MKHFILSAALLVATSASVSAKTNTPKVMANGYPYTQVPFTSVKMVHNSFWGARLQAAREVTVPLAFSKCESEHRYKNFDMAAYTLKHPGHAGLQTPEWDVAKFMGFSFDDTDVYKTIEGASYILQTYPDKKLKAYIDSVLNVVGAAQEPDGYLYTARTINPEHPHAWSGKKRWEKEEDLSHELYNLGHMVDAACAHYQATGSHKFLDIARRYADCVCREVGSESGQATVVPGHQIAEMALARLYTLTGEKRYLDEAKYLLDFRGKTHIRQEYSQSHKPILDQDEAVGHAVRAGYMYAGIADIAALTHDSAYIRMIDRIWQNIIGKKVEADLAANKGYLPVKNIKKGDVVRIHFDMPVRTVVANQNVKDDEGRVAVERGPIVYCAEAADNQGEPVLRAVMNKQPKFTVVNDYKVDNTETAGAPSFAVKAITTDAQMLEENADGVAVKQQKLTLIPYYAWNHRGAGEMNVWFVQSLKMLDK